MTETYRYPISITSQFYYCGIPLRLDSFSRCSFNCQYCFANARGGKHHDERRIAAADADQVARRFEAALCKPPKSAIDEFLHQRQPIHFGGMSDPFSPIREKNNATIQILRMLAGYQYPTVISTKSDLIAQQELIEILSKGKFVVQFSMPTSDDKLAYKIDLGTPGPSKLLIAARKLSNAGIPVTARIQPLLPSRESDGYELIDKCHEAGMRHIAVEHLKLPIERNWRGTSGLSQALNLDIGDYFRKRGAVRVGREWVLPISQRLETIEVFKKHSKRRGISFGAADNDLLLFSDGECCCCGIDQFVGFDSFFRFNYLQAARSGIQSRRISLSNIALNWRPSGSVARHINSNSRLPADVQGVGRGIEAYITANWNGRSNGNSPSSLYGVVDSLEVDAQGYKIYTIDQAALGQMG